MKIAVVTDDGTAVAQHFGRARYYQVFTVEDRLIRDTELRDRSGTLHHGGAGGHGTGHGDGGPDHARGGAHGMHAHAADRHSGMVAQLAGVNLLIAGGMGMGARRALEDAGIEVIATDARDTEQAVLAWIEGTLEHRSERLH